MMSFHWRYRYYVTEKRPQTTSQDFPFSPIKISDYASDNHVESSLIHLKYMC